MKLNNCCVPKLIPFFVIALLSFIIVCCSDQHSQVLPKRSNKSKEYRGKVRNVYTVAYDDSLFNEFLDTIGKYEIMYNILKHRNTRYDKKEAFNKEGQIMISDYRDLYYYDDNGYLLKKEDRGQSSGTLYYQKNYEYNKKYTKCEIKEYEIRKILPDYVQSNFSSTEEMLKAEFLAPDTAILLEWDILRIKKDGSFEKYAYTKNNGNEYLNWKFWMAIDSSKSEQILYEYSGEVKHTREKKYNKKGKVIAEKLYYNRIDSKSLAPTTYYHYDKNGLLVKVEKLRPKSEIPIKLIISKYNEFGDVVEYCYLDKEYGGRTEFTRKNAYLYDSQNNWIAKFEKVDNILKSVEFRQIEYWD